ncbi:hypothetical protein M513_00874 [Trichuris suis]|uniref:Uncharacterized protein n=1 Tax=Trichuris suis TaxID=68888 RepID=A0A085MLL5_9BILA|nr:hypothetical protein M513_00874 [Trichuris suis]
MDYPAAHAVLDSKSDRRSPRSPRTILTPFGWTVVGPLPYGRGLPKQPHCYRLATNDAWDDRPTDQLLDRFFSCELMCSPANHDKSISLESLAVWQQTTLGNRQRPTNFWIGSSLANSCVPPLITISPSAWTKSELGGFLKKRRASTVSGIKQGFFGRATSQPPC